MSTVVRKKHLTPPVADKTPKRLEVHGHLRIDDYYWLNDRGSREVLEHLRRENGYTGAVLNESGGLRAELLDEMVMHIKKDDVSAPYPHGDYFYYTRYTSGLEYPIYCRKKGSLEGDEEQLLDVNELALGNDYCHVVPTVSPGHDLLAYAVDTEGRRIYTLRFKDLNTGAILEDEIGGVAGCQCWANDNKSVFYAAVDRQTLRWDKIYRKTFGERGKELVFHETDPAFSVHLEKTRSERFVLIGSTSTLSSEYRYVAADEPRQPLRLFSPRQRHVEYHPDDGGDRFYVYTNLDAKNFRLMETSPGATDVEHWTQVIPHREDTLLEWVEVFAGHLAIVERRDCVSGIRVVDRETGLAHRMEFPEQCSTVFPDDNYRYDTAVLRCIYESLTTPRITIDYDMRSRNRTVVKHEEVPGGFDASQYAAERLFATAEDGARIPISLVYRKEVRSRGASPLILYAYGAYGITQEPRFSSERLSLLDRGVIFAIAHVRGGSEMGRKWYEDGKLLKKKSSFSDYIACSEHLIEQGITSKSALCAYGGSAGGLLVGAVMNMRPDLYGGVVAAVPFVDVVTTMLDEKIPLTTSEYDEWGNPLDEEYYEYMLSYSPYDNVRRTDYPGLLVTAGLHDSQVQYWEPAKWVAKVREHRTNDAPTLLWTAMDAGHSGVSGRFRRLEEAALKYAFVLSVLNCLP